MLGHSTVASSFLKQMDGLRGALRATEPHFVRCVKPCAVTPALTAAFQQLPEPAAVAVAEARGAADGAIVETDAAKAEAAEAARQAALPPLLRAPGFHGSEGRMVRDRRAIADGDTSAFDGVLVLQQLLYLGLLETVRVDGMPVCCC